ncbi:MAG: tRNA uridine 5-carboxymethylaminomethyl modification enzyme MnmG [Lentisphaerae bacterium ADurb.BinA184]|nr:MAG: tRNA uridine 5-carboxymethylaminomethyl modification enzyme MnmG [Lentisphaerae bacterium ADurb.BinA184]
MSLTRHFDVIVVGGGHAGCEAALAAARLGARTLLLTLHADHIAQMSCNPAIGGVAKGQVVREIDALGGEMARNTDASAIQFRMLNRSRGPAVHSPRAQCDKLLYQHRMKQVLERQDGLVLQQAEAVRLEVRGGRVAGVAAQFGEVWTAAAVVVATGTFLAGKLHYGLDSIPGGRAGDAASCALSTSLRDGLGLELGRLKTGTPPRLLARTLDFGAMERQDADPEPYTFSYRPLPDEPPRLGGLRTPQRPCYITHSTPATAAIIRRNLDRSPLYAGRIEGIGTRYCPSFEDKVVRFAQQETHHLFLEPEGAFTEEYYVNGISTSLPPEVQWEMIRSVPGLERAWITRFAYAIEYDFVFPHQIAASLEVKRWPGLFLAGQINGTSGYEEAAGQGLVAGVNAARAAAGSAERLVLGRGKAYIGVMIDDLVTKDIIEPYRLFTSRAEYRLHLRQDNADRRLVPVGYRLGLVPRAEYDRVVALEREVAALKAWLQGVRQGDVTLWEWLRRPEAGFADLANAPAASPRAVEQVMIEARYEGYIEREATLAAGLHELEAWRVPEGFAYGSVTGLGVEARGKLEKVRPRSLAQAARIDGITPADIALLQVFLTRGRHHPAAARTTDPLPPTG